MRMRERSSRASRSCAVGPMPECAIHVYGLGPDVRALPLALGSYWAVIPTRLIIPILVARLLNEENLLAKERKGYTEYMQKTRCRLFPGIW